MAKEENDRADEIKAAIVDRQEHLEFVPHGQFGSVSRRSIDTLADLMTKSAEKDFGTLPDGWEEEIEHVVTGVIAQKVQEVWAKLDELPAGAVLQTSLNWEQFKFNLHAAWNGETICIDTEPF